MGFATETLSRAAMRSTLLFALLCFSVALPSGAYAKKDKAPVPDDKLNCKQLAGRMQVRIMQIRGFADRKQSSALSRGIQSGLSATLGNLSHGEDPQGEYAADVKQLQDYNQRLVAKGCKSYDLDMELSKKEVDDVPVPTIPAPKKPKAAAPAAPVPAQ
jgi:hypothetical protein